LKVGKKSPRPRKKKGHRSKFETEVEILLSKRTDLTFDYEKDKLEYTLHFVYKPDWSLVPIQQDKIYLEAKGRFDYEERRKILGVLAANPEIDLRMVFMRDQKIAKNSKTYYSTWCEQHGIKYSIYPELPI